MPTNRQKNKYKAKTQFEDGYRFPSTLEWRRYRELKTLLKAGRITDLSVHPQYAIVWPDLEEKICIVELDFRYLDTKGNCIVEDVKGMDTALSKLKRKLVRAAHGVDVVLVRSVSRRFT